MHGVGEGRAEPGGTPRGGQGGCSWQWGRKAGWGASKAKGLLPGELRFARSCSHRSSPRALLQPGLLCSAHLLMAKPAPHASPAFSYSFLALQHPFCFPSCFCHAAPRHPELCPKLHRPRPHPREQAMKAGEGTAHTSHEIRAVIGTRSVNY